MEDRIKNVNLAAYDMPAPAASVLEKAYAISRQLITLRYSIERRPQCG